MKVWDNLSRKISVLIFFAFVFSLTFIGRVYAATTDTVAFQSKIVNSDGTNVTNNTYNFRFVIYSVSTGGTAKWTEDKSIAVSDGVVSTYLGSTTPFPADLFDNSDLYLQICFDANGTDSDSSDTNCGVATHRYEEVFSTRKQIASVPVALRAKALTDGAGTAYTANDFYQQGGNAFGTGATLGTTDTYNLSIVTDNVTRLVFDTAGNATFSANILPNADDTYTLGSSTLRWQDLYLGPSSLHISSTAAETTTARDWNFNIIEVDGSSEGNLVISEGTSQYLTLGTTGKLGLGTTNPEYSLEISHDHTVDSTLPALLMEDTSGKWLKLTAGAVGSSLKFDDSGYFALSPTSNKTNTNPLYNFVLSGNGNIGIGLDNGTASHKLTLNGDFAIQENDLSSSVYYTIFQGGDQTADITYTLPTALGADGQVLGTDASGNLSWVDGGTGNATLFTASDAALGDGLALTITHGQNTNDLLASAWIYSQSSWKQLDATYTPAIAWEGKDTQKGFYHDSVNSYLDASEFSVGAKSSVPEGLLFDTFEDWTKTSSSGTTVLGASEVGDDGSGNYITLRDRIQAGRVGLWGNQTLSTSTTDNAGNTYLGSNNVNDIFYYDRGEKDSIPEVQIELGIDPNWYNGVTLTSAKSQSSTIPKPNANLSKKYNGSLIKAIGRYSANARSIFITIVNETTFDWTDNNGNSASGVTITPGVAQVLGSTGISATFTNFKYNVGDVFQIASWYTEPESSIRGERQAFPERANIISTDSSVDIIDADTQKLWMRFSIGGNTGFFGSATNYIDVAEILNGSLYVGYGASEDGQGLRKINFAEDIAGRWYSNYGEWSAGISERATTTTFVVKDSSQSLLNTFVNDISAAVIPNAPTQEITVSGWGYIVGNETAHIGEDVYLPYVFNDTPTITVQASGFHAATVPDTLAACGGYAAPAHAAVGDKTGNSAFVIDMYRDGGLAFGSGYYHCYTWTATGTVSPKQFVAVASGDVGTNGGVTIINEADHRTVNILNGSQYVNTRRASKIEITKKGDLYASLFDEDAQYNTIDIYHGIAGITSDETTYSELRSGYYLGGFANTTDVGTFLDAKPTTSFINSLEVTEGTSTMKDGDNTIYVGTSNGVTVFQENNNCGTQITSGLYVCDGYLGSDSSTKYYTKDYISEEMVGDIRGMWPLNNNLGSYLKDVSIKSNNLTNNGGATFTASGVRGNAATLDGTSEYFTVPSPDLPTGDFTYGAWIKPDDISDEMIFMASDGTGLNEMYIHLSSGRIAVMLHSISVLTTEPLISAGEWSHISVSRKGDNVQVYINGELVGSATNSNVLSFGTCDLGIGVDFDSVCTGTPGNYFDGLIDEPFVTATAIPASKVKQMYETGKRALASHNSGLGGGGGADENQKLSSYTDNLAALTVIPDWNNQYMYVGQPYSVGAMSGSLSKIQLNSDTNIKTYTAGGNLPSGGVNIVSSDINNLSIGNDLNAVGSTSNGVTLMGTTSTTGNFVSKTYAVDKAFGSAVLWVSPNIDADDVSNSIVVKASNNGGSTYATCNLISTDTNPALPELEYSCEFATVDNDLKVKFEFTRGSSKTSTYITQYGVSWLGEGGFRIEQTDANNVKLYNFTGESQNVRLGVTAGGVGTGSTLWSDEGDYLKAVNNEGLRIYDVAGTNYGSIAHDGTTFNLGVDGTTALKLDSLGNVDVLGALSIRETGTSPIYKTIFQGGDQTSDITYTLPSVLGTDGQVLGTDASGNLSWVGGGSSCTTCFEDGGNAFGADAVFGTTDAYGLSVITNNTTRLVFDTSGNATFSTNILPSTDDTYSLGSSTARWQDLYLGPNSLHIGTDGNEGILSYDTVNSQFNLDKDLVIGGDVWAQSLGYVFTTLNTDATFKNNYTKFGTISLPARYQDYNGVVKIISHHSGETKINSAELHIRAKQNASLGNNPDVDLKVVNSNGIPASWFVYEIVSNAGPVVIDLYAKPGTDYTKLSGSVLVSDNSEYIEWWSEGGYVSSVSGSVEATQGIYTDASTNYLGIGTTSPNQALSLAGSLELEETVSSTSGVIYKGSLPFIHNFNPPNNGTVDPIGENTFVGLDAGNFTMGSTAGYSAQASNNTGVGYSALSINSTGYSNTAMGSYSLSANGTGYRNVAFGDQSMLSNTSGNSNSAFGFYSLKSNTSGYNNVAIGKSSMYANISGINNVAVGVEALGAVSSGNYNVGIGQSAGALRSGSQYNILVGAYADTAASTDENSVVIGYGADGAGSNSVVLGNDSITKTMLKGKVGIGTSNPLPNSQLGVIGGVLYTGNVNTYYGANISGSDSGRGVFGSNLYIDGTNFKSFGTHSNYGYSAVEASWGALNFYTNSGATTAGAIVTPSLRMKIANSGYVTFYNGHNDLAENYKLVGTAERGALISISSTSENEVVLADSTEGDLLLGVVSTAPGAVMDPDGGFTIGADTKLEYNEEKAPIVLAGTAPVIVIVDAGNTIGVGDTIGVSTEPGVGEKVSVGYTIGRALESLDYTNPSCSFANSIEEVVWPDDDGKNTLRPCFDLPDGRRIGKIMVAIQPMYIADFGGMASSFWTEVDSSTIQTTKDILVSGITSTTASFSVLNTMTLSVNDNFFVDDQGEVTANILNVPTIKGVSGSGVNINLTGAESFSVSADGQNMIDASVQGVKISNLKVDNEQTGTATILAGDTTVVVTSSYVTVGSVVVVTPSKPVLYGVEINTDGEFVITIQNSQLENVTMNWVILNK